MSSTPARSLRRGAALAALGLALAVPPAMAQKAPADPWPVLDSQIFNDRPIQDGSKIIALDAPYRAEDAAVVPVTIRILQAPDAPLQVRTLTLVIDQNPAPLAATITLGPHSEIDAISTRVRVNDYTNMRVVAEMSDGSLYMVKRFVKAAGGCSAPMVKTDGDAIAVGTMRFREFAPTQAETRSGLRQAQVMIRHPNNSGLQMDQLTHLYIPAWFVTSLHVWQGKDLLFSVKDGISISQNPEFRVEFRPDGAKTFRAEAVDSKNKTYTHQWPAPNPAT